MATPSSALAGKNSILRLYDVNDLNPVVIAEVLNASGPTPETSEIDVTNLDSTNFEFIPGLTDLGELNMPINYNPVVYAIHNQASGLASLFLSGARRQWEIEIPFTPVVIWRFRAWIKQFPLNVEPNVQVRVDVVLRLTSTLTFIDGS